MNNKLGLILLFAGAYVVLLGGLFWNMSTSADVHKVYDWFWGLSAGVVIACGAGLAIKKNILGIVGIIVALAGVVYSLFVLIYIGLVKESYFSYWILIGAAVAAAGAVIALIYHIRDAVRLKKYGPTLI